jgi:hypothetical protein
MGARLDSAYVDFAANMLDWVGSKEINHLTAAVMSLGTRAAVMAAHPAVATGSHLFSPQLGRRGRALEYSTGSVRTSPLRPPSLRLLLEGEPHGRLRPPRRRGPRAEFAGRHAPIERESSGWVPGNLRRGAAALTTSLFHATCGKPPGDGEHLREGDGGERCSSPLASLP